ncbi:sugar phosphate isomerase/epimerase family protein [Flectobacillus major]|uniref:sugar phosphate isomerase/epimerase family protein n=1 Tax=Flectobacillus major TaxID=103 RepID=UPI000429CDB9|nr:TIM barrel protein [Flectobacillus major]
MNRRDFMSTTSLASLGIMASTTHQIAFPQPEKGFSLQILATNWGFNGTVDAFCAAAKKEGYDGIEMWWPTEKNAQEELFTALKKHNLAIGYLCGGHQKDPKEHLATFQKNLEAATSQSPIKPLYINCHSGRDYFTYEQNKAFIDLTTQVSQKSGIPVYHETHRGRMLFAAHIAHNFLQKNPALELTLDISHWCNVHESLLEDQAETVQLALERTGHIHTRVGHQEGPQVNDPRAPEWEAAFQTHLKWWDTVVALKMKKGQALTMLTEFGPPNYLPTLPYTQQPVANQWAINVYMLNMLRKRYTNTK